MPSSYSTAFWFSLYVPTNYHKVDIKSGSIFFAFEVPDRFLGNHKQLQYIINMEINKRDSDSTPDLSLYITGSDHAALLDCCDLHGQEFV